MKKILILSALFSGALFGGPAEILYFNSAYNRGNDKLASYIYASLDEADQKFVKSKFEKIKNPHPVGASIDLSKFGKDAADQFEGLFVDKGEDAYGRKVVEMLRGDVHKGQPALEKVAGILDPKLKV